MPDNPYKSPEEEGAASRRKPRKWGWRALASLMPTAGGIYAIFYLPGLPRVGLRGITDPFFRIGWVEWLWIGAWFNVVAGGLSVLTYATLWFKQRHSAPH